MGLTGAWSGCSMHFEGEPSSPETGVGIRGSQCRVLRVDGVWRGYAAFVRAPGCADYSMGNVGRTSIEEREHPQEGSARILFRTCRATFTSNYPDDPWREGEHAPYPDTRADHGGLHRRKLPSRTVPANALECCFCWPDRLRQIVDARGVYAGDLTQRPAT